MNPLSASAFGKRAKVERRLLAPDIPPDSGV